MTRGVAVVAPDAVGVLVELVGEMEARRLPVDRPAECAQLLAVGPGRAGERADLERVLVLVGLVVAEARRAEGEGRN